MALDSEVPKKDVILTHILSKIYRINYTTSCPLFPFLFLPQ